MLEERRKEQGVGNVHSALCSNETLEKMRNVQSSDYTVSLKAHGRATRRSPRFWLEKPRWCQLERTEHYRLKDVPTRRIRQEGSKGSEIMIGAEEGGRPRETSSLVGRSCQNSAPSRTTNVVIRLSNLRVHRRRWPDRCRF